MKQLKTIAICTLLLSTANFTTAQHSKAKGKKIFDGKTLSGWKGDLNYWRVEDGCIVGEVTAEKPLTANTFLIYDKEVSDFELTAEFKITEEGNSGIQYRSELFTEIPFALKGYQADIDGKNAYTGINYEERGRGFLANRGQSAVHEEGKEAIITKMADGDELKKHIRAQEWNTIRVVAKSNLLQHYINDVLMSEVRDNDTSKSKLKGLVGLQAHVGPPMKVQFRNIYIK